MKSVKGKNYIPPDKSWEISERKFFLKRKGIRFYLKQYHRAIRRFFKKEIKNYEQRR